MRGSTLGGTEVGGRLGERARWSQGCKWGQGLRRRALAPGSVPSLSPSS